MVLDYRGGTRYCAVGALKFVALYASMSLVGLYVCHNAGMITGLNGIDLDLWEVGLGCILSMIPYLALAFLAGCFERGMKERMALRVTMNLYLMVRLVMMMSGIGLALTGYVDGIGVDSMINLDASMLLFTMMVIPILAMVDSYLEYVQFR